MAEYTTTHTTAGGVAGPHHLDVDRYGRALPRVSWGGIFVGAFTTLAIGILLMALGAAIGLTAFDARTGEFGQGNVWATGIYTALAIGVATFCGAFVGLRSSRVRTKKAAGAEGVAIWAVSFVGMLLFAGWMGGMAARTTANTLAPLVGGTAQAVGSAAEGVSPTQAQQLGQQAQQALPEGQQLQQQVTEISGQAADVGAAAMWWFFVSGLLGLGGGILGARAGAPGDIKGKHGTTRERETTTGYSGLREEPV